MIESEIFTSLISNPNFWVCNTKIWEALGMKLVSQVLIIAKFVYTYSIYQKLVEYITINFAKPIIPYSRLCCITETTTCI